MTPPPAQRRARRAGAFPPDRVCLLGAHDPSGALFCKQEIDAWYQPFTGSYALPDPVRLANCRIALITWEPWRPDSGSGVGDDILQGRYDSYIATWSDLLARHGGPVLLRFAHEFNGTWYPWSGSPEHYRALWRHVRRRFGAVANVHWVWSPNVPLGIAWQYWPGDAEVDVIALDGYAWDTAGPSPQTLFGSAIAEARVRGKPVMIGETACPPGRQRARWMRHVLNLPVDAVIWFNENKEQSWAMTGADAARWCRVLRTPAIGQLAERYR